MSNIDVLLEAVSIEIKNIRKEGQSLEEEFAKGFKEGYQAAERFYTQAHLGVPSSRMCQRKAPHVCNENGPCNGYPKWVRSNDIPGEYSSNIRLSSELESEIEKLMKVIRKYQGDDLIA
jgi:hypothetical protein